MRGLFQSNGSLLEGNQKLTITVDRTLVCT
jgi:hypothetical protein